ncbi:MAG TPA: IS200/IS605 family transposase [Pyrinomonadaceae bacterium]|nr:IS200/IS605 family transposase [Pyrinomonadaceae bacterium]
MSLKLQSGAHSKHALAYHLIWCVKYRNTVLTRQIGDRCKEIITEIAEQIDAQIIEIETDVDHVHVIVRLKPTHTLSSVFHRFKGGSSFRLFREFPQLRRRQRRGHLWSPAKYAVTVGGAPIEVLKKYVQEQRAQMDELPSDD